MADAAIARVRNARSGSMRGYYGTRRNFFSMAGAGLIAGLALRTVSAQSVVPTTTTATDAWPSTARDATGARFFPDALGPVQERWRIALKGGIPGTSAIVRDTVFAASFGGDIVAVERSSGITLWHAHFAPTRYGDRDLAFFAGPAVANDRLVVAGGVIACLDTRTGATLWSQPAKVGDDGLDYFWGAPFIAESMVIAGSGSGTEQPPTPGRLRAYDLATGTQRWQTELVPAGGNGGGVLAPPTIDVAAGLAFVATGAPYQPVVGDNPGTASIIALDLQSGSIVWQRQITRVQNFNSAVVVLEQRLFAANKTGFYAWDRNTGDQLWVRQLTPVPSDDSTRLGPTVGPEGGPIASDGERLYVLSNDDSAGQFVAAALAPDDGTVVWQQRFDGFTFAAPAVSTDAVAVAAADGELRLLDPATGDTRTQFSLGEGSACAPSIVGGTLVVGTGTEPFLPGQSLIGFTA